MKTIVITGATGAVGQAAAKAIAAGKSANLVLVGRNMDKLRELRADITRRGSTCELVEADMSDISAVHDAVKLITTKHERVDALVNIAAVYKASKTTDKKGREIMFVTNHLGPFTLTTGLLPLLKKTRGSKVLTVSAPSSTKLDFENLNAEKKFSSLTAFGASKMMNLLMAFRLAQAVKESGLASMAFHPGLVKSELLKEGPAMLRGILRLISSDATKTGRAIASLIFEGDVAEQNGKFYNNSLKPMKAAGYAYDNAVQNRLWKLSEELAAERN
jgi:NAD(P)-dependent dehydrogenase (short-subunit alcohol dehydrogenase family)